MNLLKDTINKIMDILKENAITNDIQEEIKNSLKEDVVLEEKEKKIIDILKGTQIKKEVKEKIKKILIENESEEKEKIKELEDIKRLTAKLKPILELFKKDGNPWSKKNTEACMDIFRKANGKTSELNLNGGVSQEEWDIFLRVKDELDSFIKKSKLF